MKSKDITVDFEMSIAPWLGKTMRLVDYYLHEAIKHKGLDLTKEQMIVLKKLYERGSLHQNELAVLTIRDKSSLTRLLVKMEKKGYITRTKEKNDKRVNNVHLTALGKDIYLKTRPVIKEIINTMEKEISEKEKEAMIQLLKKIQFNFTAETTLL